MNTIREIIIKKYTWAIDTLVRFVVYYPDPLRNSLLEDNMKNADIWRLPYPNLQNLDILEYRLESSSGNLAIQNGIMFNQGRFAINNVEQSITNYFNSLSSSVSTVTTDFDIMGASLRVKFDRLLGVLDEYLHEMEEESLFLK
jgi:hypothetical protein